MTKKEYIEKLENLILQRLKYHAPKPSERVVDYALLEAVGINAGYPIFLFKKPMNKLVFSAMQKAKKQASFNLILLEKPLFNIKKLSAMDKTYLILRDEIGGQLYNTLDQLNINYISHTQFKNDFKKEFLKIDNQEISFDYLPYFYGKKVMKDGVIADIKQFLLNGKNTIISFLNTKKENAVMKIELNIPLPRGYYSFKKNLDCIEIENMTTKEKVYFNFHLKGARFSFSNISGIESCTFACINVCCEISLLAGQKKNIFFNFGKEKCCIYDNNLMDYFFEISQKKANQIFDLKVQTRDKDFDNMFNLYLPRKIWEKWINYAVDEENINKWLKFKNEIVKTSEKGEQISKKIKGLKEVRFFRNFRWKRVFVLHNDANYLFANKIKYFNYDLLTKEIFEKNNEIYLSFADL